MKPLSTLIVVVAATFIGVGFRVGLSGTSTASQRELSSERVEHAAGLDRPATIDRPASRRQGPSEGAALSPASGTPSVASSELALARIAADCGNLLLDRARRAKDDAKMLRQAAQHYRACMAHEAGSDPLFVEVRRKLEQIDQLLLPRPAAVAPPPEAKSQPREVVAPAVKPPAQAPRMVGPDGTPIASAG